MKLLRYAAFLTAACSIIAAYAVSAVQAVERVVTFAFLWLTAESEQRPVFAFDGPALTFDSPAPLDPALLNSLRHEAGMRALC